MNEESGGGLEMQKCPQGGFHEEGEKDFPDSSFPEEPEEEKKEICEKILLLKDVLEHTRHFVSMVKCPEWQIVALDIIAKASVMMRLEQ